MYDLELVVMLQHLPLVMESCIFLYIDHYYYAMHKAALAVIIITFIFGFRDKTPPTPILFVVPSQTFNPWTEMGMVYPETITIDSFTISAQITLGQYKEYLE